MTSVGRHLSRLARLAREVLLTCAALGGVVCIVFAIAAFSGGYSLMLFKTGSMSPTIPAGSVALVQRIPAEDVRVGDIVTIDRTDMLPITHRITGIGDGSTPTERVITMRGDANPSDDPLPYTVDSVRIVRGSIPHLAPVIVQAGNPWVLGGLTVGAALLVSWAFWPRRPIPKKDATTEDIRSVEAAAVDGARQPRLHAVVMLIVAGTTLTAIAMAAPAPAAAAVSPYLVMRSDLEGAGTQRLGPVQPLFWHLDVDATHAPADGDFDISFSSVGEQDFGLQAEVRSCDLPWGNDGSCAAGDRLLRPRALVLADGTWRELWASLTPAVVYLRIALTADPVSSQDAEAGASVTVRAHASGETVDAEVDGGPNLPTTGGTSLAIFAAPAAVLIGIGIALVVPRRPAKRSHR